MRRTSQDSALIYPPTSLSIARNNQSSARSSSSSSKGGGDPTVASLGVRHYSPSGPKAYNGSLVPISVTCSNLLTPLCNDLSPSSGTGTASPVSSTPRISVCSSTLALHEGLSISTVDRVLKELIETEQSYVRDLEDLIIGYIVPLRIERILSDSDIEIVFNNIEEIYYFNKRLLMKLQKSMKRVNNHMSIVTFSKCFSDKSNCEKLISIYRKYCTSFAKSSSKLAVIQKDSKFLHVARHLRDLQSSLGHTLPLSSYLLKPVQRILKYQPLWQKMADQFPIESEEHGFCIEAVRGMAHIAGVINNCMVPQVQIEQQTQAQEELLMSMSPFFPKHENHSPKKHLHSQPSFIRVIVKQGQLLMRGAKNSRHIILFDSSLEIYKVHRTWRKGGEKEELIHQTSIPASNLKLYEFSSQTAHSNSFSIENIADTKTLFTFQAESSSKKNEWCDAIRTVIVRLADAGSSMRKYRPRKTPASSSTSSVRLPSCANTVAPKLNELFTPQFNAHNRHSSADILGSVEANPRFSASSCKPKSNLYIKQNASIRNNSPSIWSRSPSEHNSGAVNRTDSEKWKERVLWKAKSATLDFHRSRNLEFTLEKNRNGLLSPDDVYPFCTLQKPFGRKRRFYARRSSFICENHIRHQSNNEQMISTTEIIFDSNPSIVRLPHTEKPPGNRRRNTYGIKKLIDAVAKRFRSNDRGNKSLPHVGSLDSDNDVLSTEQSETNKYVPFTGGKTTGHTFQNNLSNVTPRRPLLSMGNQPRRLSKPMWSCRKHEDFV